MTVEEFKKNYCCKTELVTPDDVHLHLITKVFKRIDGKQVDRVKTVLEIQKASLWIQDSNTQVSLNSWSSDILVEEMKRTHLQYFAERAPIDNWYPLDVSSP